MVTVRKRAKEEEATEEAKKDGNGRVSGYEECRDKRIKENMERMQKLGILELSKKLKSDVTSKRLQKNPSSVKKKNLESSIVSDPPRRSSRLKTITPINYKEKRNKKERKLSKDVEIRIKEGSKPEVYTEEQVKLLGDSMSEWTVYVDGYDKDGQRIYDPVEGKSCHQCRQKTLGLHTHCSKCTLGQGQLCGDCLYMRYGENVLETNNNPNWICPFCRGICNCSCCRRTKGLAPTGSIYKKVSSLGYKSVAHYLIQTDSQTNLKDSDAEKLPTTETDYSSECQVDNVDDERMKMKRKKCTAKNGRDKNTDD